LTQRGRFWPQPKNKKHSRHAHACEPKDVPGAT
jgi:hypothetical protein